MSFSAKRKILRVSTYSKVLSLMMLVSIGFLVLYAALFYYNYEQEKLFKQASIEQSRQEVNSLLELNSDSYLTLINEMTYWDELVNFAEKKDINWFNTSIAYLVDTYKVDYIDGYNNNLEFITKVSTTQLSSYNFIPKEIFPKLKKEKLIKFYVKIPEGIVQVYGATIHPSLDPFKNKTKPRGYFFMAKLLDDQYFSKFETISGFKIKFINSKDDINTKSIYYIKDIKDFNNKNIGKLLFFREVKVDFSITRTILTIMIIAFLITLLVFMFYAKRWIQTPNKLIKEVLENGNMNAINSLKKTRGEFRDIGKLFEENHNQKRMLQIAKNKAEESDKLKSAFLMNLSHEIRTPMNAIMGFSEMLSNPNNSIVEREDYIANLRNSGENLIHIIDDLIEMSKIDSNIITPNYSGINLHEKLQDIFNQVKATNNFNQNIDYKFIFPTTIPQKKIITDAIKLNQIVVNLLTNAVKFTHDGFIILEYSINDKLGMINISIKDSGIGIPVEYQQNIFQRFSKIDNIYNIKNKGLGLGLAIVKSYVDMLGGIITLKSKEGVGSTFSVSVPFKYDKQNIDEIKNKSNNSINLLGNEEIVLVAEDDAINFKIIEKMLKTFNYRILWAKNGKEAYQMCKENQEIDLVLMDIKMPESDGYEGFKFIRTISNIPIIAQTAYSFTEEIEKIKKTGFNEFISKPIDKEKLFEIIKKYMVKD